MSKKFLVVLSVLVIAAFVGALYWKTYSLSRATVPIPQPSANITDKNTVAYNWNWRSFTENASTDANQSNTTETPSVDEVPYNVVRIYEMLQEVRLDDEGNVVIDNSAKFSLEKAYNELGPDINSRGISQLQELIRIGLPGIAGEQTADILGNYYNYRLAEQGLVATQSKNEGAISQNYEQLVQLRRSYLGADIAEQLFTEEEIQARHMMASMAILRDENLSEEEKIAQQNTLQEQLDQKIAELYPEQWVEDKVIAMREQGASEADVYQVRAEVLGEEQAQLLANADQDRVQWQQRFRQYWQEREQINRAGLSEADKQKQITQLMAQHFQGEELERAKIEERTYSP